MSQPVYSHEFFIWPGTHESVPANILATSFRSVYLRLCIVLVDNYYIQNGRTRYHRIVRDMCYPFDQILELVSDALDVIRHQLLRHGTGVNIDVQTMNDFRRRVVLCATDMEESPLYSGHTVQPINVWVICEASRPGILAVPAEQVEEEDDEYEDEEDQEGEEEEQEGQQEEQEEGQEEQEEQQGDQQEQGEQAADENNNQHELPLEALVTALVVDGVTCSVCHDELEAGSMASRLPCFHFFHEPCIRRWLSCKRVCPNCRFHLG